MNQLEDSGDEDTDEYAALEREFNEIDAKQDVFTPEQIAASGVVLFIDWRGSLARELGVCPEGSAAPTTTAKAEDDESSCDPDDEANQRTGTVHSAALVEDLTARKTAAIQCELARNAHLVAVVHSMLLSVAYPRHDEQSALQISLTEERLERSVRSPETCGNLAQFAAIEKHIDKWKPANPADLWSACQKLTQEQLLNMLAYAAAKSVNVIERKPDDRSKVRAHGDDLAGLLGLHQKQWFTPTAANYFNHITTANIAGVVTMCRGEPTGKRVAGMKKADAAQFAEAELAGNGWLPEPVRITHQCDLTQDVFSQAAE